MTGAGAHGFDGPPPREREPEQLTLDLDGWEGPLDLLLSLARGQKVDLRQISILDLAKQYLDYVDSARSLKLELAADYLVMAAWLAFLKSALLLPKEEQADPSPEELALRLQLRLERLNAMRDAGARLMARDRDGRDVFARGDPEGLRVTADRQWDCDYFTLINAYGQLRARTTPSLHVVKRRAVVTLEEAIDRLSRMIAQAVDWTRIEHFLAKSELPELRKSSLASGFVAALELARQGHVLLEQEDIYEPLMLKARR